MRASKKRLSERTEFLLQDYRDVSGKFDRIVSVGMFEHVGVGFYGTFFRKCRELLDDNGVSVMAAKPGVAVHPLSKQVGADQN